MSVARVWAGTLDLRVQGRCVLGGVGGGRGEMYVGHLETVDGP